MILGNEETKHDTGQAIRCVDGQDCVSSPVAPVSPAATTLLSSPVIQSDDGYTCVLSACSACCRVDLHGSARVGEGLDFFVLEATRSRRG